MTEASLQKTVVRYLRAALAPMGGVVGVIPNNPQARRTVGFTSNFVDGYGWFVWQASYRGPVELVPA